MRRDNYAQIFSQSEGVVELFIGNAECSLVGQENFEAGIATPNNVPEIALRFAVMPRHSHVKGVIAGARAMRLIQPQFECFHRPLVASRTYHFDKSGGSTD